MNYAVRRGLGPRTPAGGRKRREDSVGHRRSRERDGDGERSPHGPEPLSTLLLILPRALPAFLLPPAAFTCASTFAAYATLRAADTSPRPIEIFIPARLPFQFMSRTSEMHPANRSAAVSLSSVVSFLEPPPRSFPLSRPSREGIADKTGANVDILER